MQSHKFRFSNVTAQIKQVCLVLKFMQVTTNIITTWDVANRTYRMILRTN